MKILISGFEPFDTHKENSSQVIAKMLSEVQIEGVEIYSVILPVTFSTSFEILKNEILQFEPDYVLCLGLAGNRKTIDLEKVAINLIHCGIADNEGVLQKNVSVLPDGPVAYFSALPIEQLEEVETQYPVTISFSAGAYVCNFLMYRVLHELRNSNKTKAGFIHLPPLGEDRDKILQTMISLIIALN